MSEEEGERKKLETDPSKLLKYCELEEANRIDFLEEYGIGKEIMDCFTIYYEDVAIGVNKVLRSFKFKHYLLLSSRRMIGRLLINIRVMMLVLSLILLPGWLQRIRTSFRLTRSCGTPKLKVL